jgi:hypothetical protein
MSDGTVRVEHVCLFALFASVWGLLQTKGERPNERRESKRSNGACLLLFASVWTFCRPRGSGSMRKRVANLESKGSSMEHVSLFASIASIWRDKDYWDMTVS